LRYAREHLAPYQRIRRLEFAELPKTISGKIRRVELRLLEQRRFGSGERGPAEFREDEFPELRDSGAAMPAHTGTADEPRGGPRS
jgi:acetyl-CoA synthetase